MIKSYYTRFVIAVMLSVLASVYDSYIIPLDGAWFLIHVWLCFVYGGIAGYWVTLPMRRYAEHVQYKK